MSEKWLSKMSPQDILEYIKLPVSWKPDDGKHYAGNPFTDDANEFGDVIDANGDWILSGQNGRCLLIVDALNEYHERHNPIR